MLAVGVVSGCGESAKAHNLARKGIEADAESFGLWVVALIMRDKVRSPRGGHLCDRTDGLGCLRG